MKKYKGLLFWSIFLLVLLTVPQKGYTSNQSAENLSGWQEDVSELNQKIALLTRWQEGYKMTAEQAEFQADRLQFRENNLIDAKRLWKVAANARQKAEDLNVIITKLTEQRNTILKRHNQPLPKQKNAK